MGYVKHEAAPRLAITSGITVIHAYLRLTPVPLLLGLGRLAVR